MQVSNGFWCYGVLTQAQTLGYVVRSCMRSTPADSRPYQARSIVITRQQFLAAVGMLYRCVNMTAEVHGILCNGAFCRTRECSCCQPQDPNLGPLACTSDMPVTKPWGHRNRFHPSFKFVFACFVVDYELYWKTLFGACLLITKRVLLAPKPLKLWNMLTLSVLAVLNLSGRTAVKLPRYINWLDCLHTPPPPLYPEKNPEQIHDLVLIAQTLFLKLNCQRSFFLQWKGNVSALKTVMGPCVQSIDVSR